MQSDHDLLITLIATTKEGFRALHESVQDLKKSMDNKANSEYVGTLEKRIDSLEEESKASGKKIYLITGGVAVAQFAIVLAVSIFRH